MQPRVSNRTAIAESPTLVALVYGLFLPPATHRDETASAAARRHGLTGTWWSSSPRRATLRTHHRRAKVAAGLDPGPQAGFDEEIYLVVNERGLKLSQLALLALPEHKGRHGVGMPRPRRAPGQLLAV